MPALQRPRHPHPLIAFALAARTVDDPLELETRRRVFLTVHRYPGLSIAELSRQVELDEDLVRYHLRVLEGETLVRLEEDGGHKRVFGLKQTKAGTQDPLDDGTRELLALLRRPPVLRAVVALIEQGPLAAGELADACGITPGTMSQHLRRMDEGDLIRIERDGRRRIIELASEETVLELLAQHPPPDDMVQSFVETWDDLGF